MGLYEFSVSEYIFLHWKKNKGNYTDDPNVRPYLLRIKTLSVKSSKRNFIIKYINNRISKLHNFYVVSNSLYDEIIFNFFEDMFTSFRRKAIQWVIFN